MTSVFLRERLRRGRTAAFLSLLCVASCGDFPQPFAGNPGATAARLARPPEPRLVVSAPSGALLSNRAASLWADLTAAALAEQEIPAIVARDGPGNWQLVLSAHTDGQMVLPSYAVLDPKGQVQGSAGGPPVAAEGWALGDDATLRDAAAQAAPKITSVLTSIQAAVRQSDPNSLINRPARIAFTGVAGAPGDGNASLARQMRVKLPDKGDIVQATMANADFVLKGVVTAKRVPQGQQQIEIHWIVTEAVTGKEAGDVAQGHDVPAGSLDEYWGDVAAVVAEEAADGIHEVISNWSGRRDTRKTPHPASG